MKPVLCAARRLRWRLPAFLFTVWISCCSNSGGPGAGPCSRYPLRQEAVETMGRSAAAAMDAAGEEGVAPMPAYDGPSLYSTSVFDVQNVLDRRETGLLIGSQAELEAYLDDIGFSTLAGNFNVNWESETLMSALLWPMQFVYLYGKGPGGLTLYAGHLLPCEDYDPESLRLYFDAKVTFLKFPRIEGSGFSVVALNGSYRFVEVEASGDCERAPSGPVMDRVGGSSFVMVEGGRYRMWYGGFSAATGVIFDTLSDDGIAWAPGGWDPGHTCEFESHSAYTGHYGPSIVVRPDGTYWMYYYDENFNYEERGLLARSESADGIHWGAEVAALEPGGAGQWDDGGIARPSVIEQDGTFRMWYSGWRDGGSASIGLATSSDGTQWERHPASPVLVPGPAGTFDDLGVGGTQVQLVDGRYLMWYSASTGGGDWRYPQTSSFALATSNDGILWTRPAAPLLAAGDGFEFQGIFDPAAVMENGGFMVWYTGVNKSFEPSIGRAVCRAGE